jgi:hypothetical protein
MEKLAQYVELSRPSLMKVVALKAEQRSKAKAETAVRLAEPFGIDLSDLYRPPRECLQAVVDAFDRATIASFVHRPGPRIRVHDDARRARVVDLRPPKGGRRRAK